MLRGSACYNLAAPSVDVKRQDKGGVVRWCTMTSGQHRDVPMRSTIIGPKENPLHVHEVGCQPLPVRFTLGRCLQESKYSADL